MIGNMYRGSVKDVLGPARATGGFGTAEAAVFDYTDAYSVFDWGRMPDTLPRKGEALAVLAADLFERLERPETWREFSKSHEALELRKANRLGAVFNELGEKLQAEGLRTHFLGVLDGEPASTDVKPVKLGELNQTVRRLVVRKVSATRPRAVSVFGRALYDYSETRVSPLPRLIPLEVVFRFSCPPGSSLLERAAQDPGYLVSRGLPEGTTLQPGHRFAFPFVELFTKLESSDRPLSFAEALAISGIPAETLQLLLLKTVWVAGVLRAHSARSGLELADGKMEWAVTPSGDVLLVDAIGPDELRLLRGGVQLSKEFLRTHYRASHWYSSLIRAKKQAALQGSADWKRLTTGGPPPLPPQYRELGSHLYLALANALCGRTWFPDAWSLDRVTSAIAELEPAGDRR